MFSKSALLTILTISANCLAAIAQPAGAALSERNADAPNNALANFPGCDAKQTETLRRAIPVAQRYQTEAWEYVWDSIPVGISYSYTHVAVVVRYFRKRGRDPPAANTDMKRYTIWFGAYSPARYTIVYNRFERLSAYPLDQWSFQCMDSTDPDCGGMVEQYWTNAYSLPMGLDPHTRIATIRICKGFFNLLRSDDDNGQSIIHEASHFHLNGVAGTNNGRVEEDYGTTGCLALAKAHPDQAVDNADNYGYFAQYPDGCGKCYIQ
ncbi:hypothetical protein PLEOSDRAFT_1080092 [Pleurotus ostreatus PC15]|uniref:Lysine-specific metallo-endopeptidase domain-containing protein n=1 Tax=Pleurotus ostreatus (strain PC15) TaxID=1137138 RepID=A0A067NX74_PLEO1|nr:hypothetical protein PLEOSDRAFT_1080092 [Pleurotus ostreatus PC15]